MVITEWNQFRMLDLERVKSLLREPLVVDLRNIYEPGRDARRRLPLRVRGRG